MQKTLYPNYHSGKLDCEAETLIRQLEAADIAPVYSLTVNQARDCFLDKSWFGPAVESVKIESRTIENSGVQIPLRVYTPAGQAPFPLLLFFHGGGYVLGSAENFDPFCTLIASGASCVVVSVDYRLAPEHKHPAAVEDAATALKWIYDNAVIINGDASRLAVAGDSAGGNLAAVSCMLARDSKSVQLIHQVLICPWVDAASFDTDSYKFFGNGLWLSAKSMPWYCNHYLQNDAQKNSYLVSPLRAENLKDLPPALIITAEFDILRDEAEAYAGRLGENGVPVKLTRYNGTIHDFVTLPGVFSKANEAIEEICGELKKAFRK